jgi:hypothetical protein
MHGHGVYTWANGTKYEGMYACGKHLPGKGEYTWRTPFVSHSRPTELNKKKNMKAANRPSSTRPPARKPARPPARQSFLGSPAKARPSLRAVAKTAVITNMLARQKPDAHASWNRQPPVIVPTENKAVRLFHEGRVVRYTESAEEKKSREEMEALHARIHVMFNASLDAFKVMQISDKSLSSHGLAEEFCKEHDLPPKTVGRVHRLVKTTRENMSHTGVGVHLLAVTMRRVRHGIRMQNMWNRDAMAALKNAARQHQR